MFTNDSLYDRYTQINTKNTINEEWIEEQVGARKIYAKSAYLISEVSQLLSTLHPDNWDLQIYPTTNDEGNRLKYFPFFIIKYDDFIITNSKNHSNRIKDLYIGIPIILSEQSNMRKHRIDYICGTRGILSDAEKTSSYLHSHLGSPDSIIKWKTFCTGSDSLSATKMMLDTEWSIEVFELFVHQLFEFAKWESTEGGPYRYIKNISIKTKRSNIYLSAIEVHELYDITRSLYANDFDIVIEDGRYCIDDNDKFDTALKKLVPTKYWSRRGINGNHYVIEHPQSEDTNPMNASFVWKGEEVSQIEIYKTLTDREEDKVVDPVVKNIIINRLEALLAEKKELRNGN